MTTTHTAPTRTHDGVTLPAPGVWEIDPGHADVSFIGRHFMITKVRGRFTDVKGAVTIAEDLAASTVDVTIGMASVDSGQSSPSRAGYLLDSWPPSNHSSRICR